jgi:hypothetical protein
MRDTSKKRKRKKGVASIEAAPDLAPPPHPMTFLQGADLQPEFARPTPYLSGMDLPPEEHRNIAETRARQAHALARQALVERECEDAVRTAVTAREIAAVSMTHSHATGGSGSVINDIASEVQPIFDRCVVKRRR